MECCSVNRGLSPNYCPRITLSVKFMEEKNNSLNIATLVELKKKDLNQSDPTEIQRLNIALQSIAKRLEYCKYHHDQLIANSGIELLFTDRFSSSNPEKISIRTIYEANTVAFLQNLHSLIDSLPYALNIIFRVVDDIESPNIGWNDDFINKYNSHAFFGALSDLHHDETFQKIKGFTNRTKHKHLIRIKNKINQLVFDDFSYRHNDETKQLKNQDVKSFLVDCHDGLTPKFLSLYNAVKASKEARSLD